jgi:nucleoid-associated protein YgaU
MITMTKAQFNQRNAQRQQEQLVEDRKQRHRQEQIIQEMKHKNKQQNILLIIATMITIITLICLINHSIQERKANYNYESTINYTVKANDSLWKIAEQFSDNRHDVRIVIDEIQKLSDTGSLIFPGQQLTIPVYCVLIGGR